MLVTGCSALHCIVHFRTTIYAQVWEAKSGLETARAHASAALGSDLYLSSSP